MDRMESLYNAVTQSFAKHYDDIKLIVGDPVLLEKSLDEQWQIRTDNARGATIAVFSIDSMHGCGPIAIFHGSNIKQAYRGRGLGKLLFEMKLAAVRNAGFKIVLVTTVSTNTAQNLILNRFEFQPVSSQFVNPRSGNTVMLWSRKV